MKLSMKLMDKIKQNERIIKRLSACIRLYFKLSKIQYNVFLDIVTSAE